MSFVFGDPAEQRVAVTLDVNGNATSYSDMRGDLNVSDGREGDRTMIAINLLRGQAVVENRPEGGEPEAMLLSMEEAMAAPNLGRPGDMIERIISTCAN